jgi:hypothetical protein
MPPGQLLPRHMHRTRQGNKEKNERKIGHPKYLRPTLAARFPGGIPAFSRADLPRANLSRAKLLRSLAAHPPEDLSPLPILFHAVEIHDS